MEEQGLRICTKCGVSYPNTKEFFGSGGKGRLSAVCKECKKQWKKEYYLNKPKPRTEQYRFHGFMIRFHKLDNVYRVWKEKTWTYLGEFSTLEEAKEYIKDK